MKSLIIITFATCVLLFAACVPKDLVEPITDSGQTPDPNTYMPVHKGSTWTYYFYMRGKTDVINNPTEGTKTITMTGDSINQLGVVFYKALAVTNTYTNNVYFSKTGSIYIMNDDDANTFAPELNSFLCLNESVDAAYRTSIIVNPPSGSTDLPLQYINQIQKKNISTGLNGIWYNNVIEVVSTCKLVTPPGQAAETVDDIYYTFAKGVGLIKMVVYHHNVRVLEISLYKYTIK